MVAAQAVVGVIVVTTSLGKDAVPTAVARADGPRLLAPLRRDVPPPFNGGGTLATALGRPGEVMAPAGDGGVVKKFRGPSRLQASDPQATPQRLLSGGAVHAYAA